jgi:hypothetical protein
VRGLQNAVLAAWNLSGEAGKAKAVEIASELLRHRYWVDDTARLSAAQLAEVREAVTRWGRPRAAAGREWLQVIGGSTTESMVVDADRVVTEAGVTDPFVLAALSLRFERLEATTDTAGN